ncbi:MAG: hypothetical protein KDI36_00815, partial [Pseudomonadales bacterium]|nr:hypothetical protein [Pseudomonadales bacterium]
MNYLSASYAPVEHAWYLRSTFVAINLSALFFAAFLMKLLGLHYPRALKVFGLFLAGSSLYTLVVPPAGVRPVLVLTDALSMLVIVVLVGIAVRQSLKRERPEADWVSAAGIVTVLLLSHDLWIFSTNDRSASIISAGHYMQFAFAVVLVMFFIYLINRFVTALNAAETLNVELERRVAAISADLEQSYAANRALELKRATDLQKQRIYRDLHDDVGARLVSIVHAREKGDTVSMARSALESLRETVSKGNAEDTPLLSLLGALIEEAELRCRNSSLGFELMLSEDLPEGIVPAESCYQLSRIIREVISNVLRHASAEEVTLKVALQDNNLVVELQDDGVGLPSAVAEGNGLGNIRSRASDMGAAVSWQNAEHGGVKFCFSIPLLTLFGSQEQVPPVSQY